MPRISNTYSWFDMYKKKKQKYQIMEKTEKEWKKQKDG